MICVWVVGGKLLGLRQCRSIRARPFLRLAQQPRTARKNPAPPRERCNRTVRDTL